MSDLADLSMYGPMIRDTAHTQTPEEAQMEQLQLQHVAMQNKVLSSQADDSTALKTAARTVQAKALAEGRTPDPSEYEDAFRAIGTPSGFKAAHESVQARSQSAKAQRDAGIAQVTLDKAHNDEASRVTGGILALPPEQRAAAWPNALQEFAKISPEKAQSVGEKYPQYPGDDVVSQMHQFTLSEQNRLALSQQAQLKTHQDADLAERTAYHKEDLRIKELAARKPTTFQLQQSALNLPANFDPSVALSNAAAEATAHRIGSWEANPPPENIRTPLSQMEVARAQWLGQNQYGHPEGLPGVADIADTVKNRPAYGPTGQVGQQITAGGTAVKHLNSLEKLGTALQNGDNTAINDIGNRYAKLTGQPAPTNFQSTLNLVVPEVLRAAKGAGVLNEAEEKRFMDQISSSSSPDQIKGFANEMIHRIGERFNSLQPGYARYNRNHNLSERLDPEAMKLFDKAGISFGANGAGGGSGGPGASPASPGAPSYKGVTMPSVKFNSLSAAAQKAFKDGGGEVAQ